MSRNRRLKLQTVPPSTASPGQGRLSPGVLARQNQAFHDTGGVSKGNAECGFLPAFKDCRSGIVYLSRFANGNVAPMHLLDGLPEELVAERGAGGCVTAIKAGVTAGFVRDELFYTREQAARAVAQPGQPGTTAFTKKGG